MAPEIKKTPAIMTPSRGINNIKSERMSLMGIHNIQNTSKQIIFTFVSYLKKTIHLQKYGVTHHNRTQNVLTHSLPLVFQEKLALRAKHFECRVWFLHLKIFNEFMTLQHILCLSTSIYTVQNILVY